MAQAFFDAFCLDSQWDAIAAFTNSSGGDLFGHKAFAFGDYTPCVADGGILSVSYLLFVILASVRLGQLCSRRQPKGRVLNKCRMLYRFSLVLLVWLVFVFQLLKDELLAGPAGQNSSLAPLYSTVGDVCV